MFLISCNTIARFISPPFQEAIEPDKCRATKTGHMMCYLQVGQVCLDTAASHTYSGLQRSPPDNKSPWGSPERVVGGVIFLARIQLSVISCKPVIPAKSPSCVTSGVRCQTAVAAIQASG